VASVGLTASGEPVGVVEIIAKVGDASDSTLIAVTCASAGPPTSISLSLTPATIACGSQASALATLRDSSGNLAPDGTLVGFAASGNGAIVPLAPTISGVATSVYTAFPGTSGVVQIAATITGTSITATAAIQVTCAAAATSTVPVPPTIVITPTAPATGITPPSTGDGGLAR
jgi:hypothetical protein